MAKTVADVMKMVNDNEVKFVDFRFTDTRGKEQHVTVPVSHFDARHSGQGLPRTRCADDRDRHGRDQPALRRTRLVIPLTTQSRPPGEHAHRSPRASGSICHPS